MEIWKDIQGYEGYYQISSYGNVRSLDRECGYLPKRGCDLKKRIDRNGYACVSLQKRGIVKGKLIHRLVAEAFIKKEEGKNEINHIDENKQNNHAENLEWCTRTYNMNYGSRPNAKAKKVIQLDKFNNPIFEFKSAKEASRITGINYGNITNCCRGNVAYAGGYKWTYK